ncbi:MAG: zf-HC2 domain-containing protein [Ktedonobacteraceae bacterium]
MSNHHQLTENSSYSDSPHEKIILLLDAYFTGELEDDEQEAVEQHLASCRECQQLLATVRQFRGLFSRLSTHDRQNDWNGESVQMSHDDLSSRFADRVLDEITAKREERMRQQPIAEIPRNHLPAKNTLRRRNWRTFLPVIAAVLCVVLLAGSLLPVLTNFRQPSSGSGSQPSSLNWERYQGQFFAQNTEGTFSIKYMDITNQEFHFFYAFRSPHEGVPGVEVVSYPASNPRALTKLVTTVQSLGYLGGFNVGVVHARGLNRVGQIIALQITPPGKNTPTLRLAPLKQLLNYPFDSSRTYWGFPVEQTGLPEVFWYGPVMMENVAFFKSGNAKQPGGHVTYIFVRLDDPIVVKVITQKEYLAIAGQQNFF